VLIIRNSLSRKYPWKAWEAKEKCLLSLLSLSFGESLDSFSKMLGCFIALYHEKGPSLIDPAFLSEHYFFAFRSLPSQLSKIKTLRQQNIPFSFYLGKMVSL